MRALECDMAAAGPKSHDPGNPKALAQANPEECSDAHEAEAATRTGNIPTCFVMPLLLLVLAEGTVASRRIHVLQQLKTLGSHVHVS